MTSRTTTRYQASTQVAATHPVAQRTARETLDAGGNACDAAVAGIAGALSGAPHLAGWGGDCQVMVSAPFMEAPVLVDGQGTVPQRATIEYFKGLGLTEVPATGLLAAGVPGVVGGLLATLAHWGSQSLTDTLTPAVQLARIGVPTDGRLLAAWEMGAPLFTGEWTTTQDAIHIEPGRAGEPSMFIQPSLSDLLTRFTAEADRTSGGREARIAAARTAWYEGFIAEDMVAYCGSARVLDSSGDHHHGLLTATDLANWSARKDKPLAVRVGSATVHLPGGASQGLAVAVALSMAAPDVDARVFRSLVDHPDAVHGIVECIKLAQADRYAWSGDVGTEGPSNEELLSSAYSESRRAWIGDGDASLELRPGAPAGRRPRFPGPPSGSLFAQGAVPRNAALAAAGPSTLPGEGVSVCVAGDDGLVVSIQAYGGTMQRSPIIPGLGFAHGTAVAGCSLASFARSKVTPGCRPPHPGLVMHVEYADGSTCAVTVPGVERQVGPMVFAALQAACYSSAQDAVEASEDWLVAAVLHGPGPVPPSAADLGRVIFASTAPEALVTALRRRGHDTATVAPHLVGTPLLAHTSPEKPATR